MKVLYSANCAAGKAMCRAEIRVPARQAWEIRLWPAREGLIMKARRAFGAANTVLEMLSCLCFTVETVR